MRIALAGALAMVFATPVVADAPIDWVTRFAFLHAVKAKWLPPGPESWKAFACVAKAAEPISDRDPTPPIRNWAVYAEADEAIAPCKAEMDAIRDMPRTCRKLPLISLRSLEQIARATGHEPNIRKGRSSIEGPRPADACEVLRPSWALQVRRRLPSDGDREMPISLQAR